MVEWRGGSYVRRLEGDAYRAASSALSVLSSARSSASASAKTCAGKSQRQLRTVRATATTTKPSDESTIFRATFGFRKSSASVHGAGGSSRSPAQPSADGGTVTMKRRPATSCGIPTISAKSAFALKIPAKSEWLMYLSSEDGGWEW